MANEGAKAGDDVGEDPLNFRPNPEALVSKVEEDAEEHGGGDGGAGVYRPPKMLPTAMEDFEEGGKSAKEKRKEKEARRRANRSALIKVRQKSLRCDEIHHGGWRADWRPGAISLSLSLSPTCLSVFHSRRFSSGAIRFLSLLSVKIRGDQYVPWHRANVLNLGQGTTQIP